MSKEVTELEKIELIKKAMQSIQIDSHREAHVWAEVMEEVNQKKDDLEFEAEALPHDLIG